MEQLMKKNQLLQVAKSNQKFDKRKDKKLVLSISLLAGVTCPFAKECLAKAVIKERIVLKDGSVKLKLAVKDGPQMEFRCFSASQEAQYVETYLARLRNFNLIKKAYKKDGISGVADLLETSLKANQPKRDPDSEQLIRVHVSGDMFASWYFLAWCEVARRNPLWVIYGYTKALPLVLKYRRKIPKNFVINLSRGGTHDRLISRLEGYGFKSATVVYSKAEAKRLGLKIDKDDSLASDPSHPSFALLIHGTQAPGSDASKALVQIRKRAA
jgi:hypothetical protein